LVHDSALFEPLANGRIELLVDVPAVDHRCLPAALSGLPTTEHNAQGAFGVERVLVVPQQMFFRRVEHRCLHTAAVEDQVVLAVVGQQLATDQLGDRLERVWCGNVESQL
jgi:hypothetical protein